MGVKRTGDWNKAKAKLNGTLGTRIAMALQQATIRNALFLVREIQRGIRNQAPGGNPLPNWLTAPSDVKVQVRLSLIQVF